MKFLVTCLTLAVAMCGMNPAFAATRDQEYRAEFRFNRGAGWQNDQVGTKIIEDQVRHLMVTYDFAVQGGAITTKYVLPRPSTPGRPAAPSGVIPKNAIVVGCYIDVLTALTTSASGTLALSTGQGAGDLKTATAAASYTGIVACTPTGTAASSIKITADATPFGAIATGALTAGKLNLHIFYLLSD